MESLSFSFKNMGNLQAPINDVTPFNEAQAAVEYVVRELKKGNIAFLNFSTDTEAPEGTFSPQSASTAAFYLATRGYYVYNYYTMKDSVIYEKTRDKWLGYQVRKTPCVITSQSAIDDVKWQTKPEVCQEYVLSCQIHEQNGLEAEPIQKTRKPRTKKTK